MADPAVPISPKLKEFVLRAVVPALVERFLREQPVAETPGHSPMRPAA